MRVMSLMSISRQTVLKMRVRRRENLGKAADREMALATQRQAAPQKVDLTEWWTHTR